MTECSLMLKDTKPIVKCETCSPCVVENTWGMTFDCFEGRWKADECVSGSRVGHIPDFPKKGDPEFIKDIFPNKSGETVSAVGRGKEGFTLGNLDSSMFLIIIVGGSILVGIVMGVIVSLRMNTKARRQLPTKETVTATPAAAENVEGRGLVTANRDNNIARQSTNLRSVDV